MQTRTDHESNLRGFWIRGSGVPILFCDVIGQEGSTKRDSKCNDVEAAKVVSRIGITTILIEYTVESPNNGHFGTQASVL